MKVYGLWFTVYGLALRKEAYLILLLIFLFTNSCKTDFNIIAPYKQTTVVYGLLDPADSIQYIKINKAFLGQGNALVMAQQKDSINYAPGALKVQLQSFNLGSPGPIYTLDTTTAIPKDPGIFSNPYQLLYETTQPITQDGVTTYNLIITNNSDQQTLTSSTSIVGAIDPNSLSHPYPGELVNFTDTATPQYQLEFNAPANARLFSLVIRFSYIEINTAMHDTTNKYIDWNQGTQKTQNLNTSEQITFTFNRSDFYGFVRSQLAVDPNLKRLLPYQPIDFIITYAGDELSTYIDVNQPSLGIVQTVPVYTNIKNGIGIFSSRSSLSLSRSINPISIDSLDAGQVTGVLNFQ